MIGLPTTGLLTIRRGDMSHSLRMSAAGTLDCWDALRVEQ